MHFKKFPLLLIFALSYYCHAQSVETKKPKGGVKLKSGTDWENARFIIQVVEAKEIKHTPYDLPGYRLHNGRTYRAMTIKAPTGEYQRYFFEVLAKDSVQFYYFVDENFRKVYYMSARGSGLKELSQTSLYESLKTATQDCSEVSENIQYVKLTRHHLARFGEDYRRCTSRAFPHLRFGLKVAVNQNTYNQQSSQESLFFPKFDKFSAAGFSFGVSIDQPIEVSNFSFNAAPTLDYYRGSEKTLGYDKLYNLMFKDVHVSLPVNLRYSFYRSMMTPFIEGGIVYSHHLSGNTTLYEFEQEGNRIFLTKRDELLFVPKQQFGVTIAAGAVMFSREKYSMSLQACLRTMRPLSSSMISTRINVLSLSAGIVF